MTEHKNTRGAWGSQIGFLFAAIGSSIGLGNIWRFPYIVYENGGGAFLIPYLIALLCAGIPVMILEFGLGRTQHGSASLAFAKISRRVEWVGWWMPTIACFGIMFYYTVVISWCANFFFYSLNLNWGGETQDFFRGEFLQLSDGVFNLGGVVPHIMLSVGVVWFIIWFICFREVSHGIERACKIFLPLLFIMTLFLVVWGLTLPGAMEGIRWYLQPDFAKLLNVQVWVSAFGQMFFSLTLGFGVMIAYASYLPKKTNIVRNAYITGFCNCFMAILAGFAVFSILGYMAQKSGLPIESIIKSGPTLAFVVYPKGISMLPAFKELFGLLFFGVLVIAGTSSSISLVESFSSSFTDKFNLERRKVVTVMCIIGFLGSLLFATSAGLYWLDIVDHYLAQYGLVASGIMECLVIGWALKARVLRRHINRISGTSIGGLWDALVRIFTPGILFIILATNLVREFTHPYGGYNVLALLVLGVGWLVMIGLLAGIFTLPRWDPKKIRHIHFAEEDSLMV